MRLDDACEKRDVDKWNQIEKLLDKYEIKPLVGLIPHCEDPNMEKYKIDSEYWNRISLWSKKQWEFALHGFNHVYSSQSCGLNPLHQRSEFAGEPLEIQKQKIKEGVSILRSHGINPLVFFAPAHTFDFYTLSALKSESDIRIISDTIANQPYSKFGITFVPQQSGQVRNLPLKIVTFCYHPNLMNQEEFNKLESFLSKKYRNFIPFPLTKVESSFSFFDFLLTKTYFWVRRIKR